MKPSKRDEAAQAFRTGLTQQRTGDLAAAEGSYRRALSLAADHDEAHNMMGLLAHQTGRGDLAVTHLRRAVALKPSAAGYHNNLGGVLYELGRFPDAARSYRKALRLQPNRPDFHCNLGSALAGSGEFSPAAESFGAALALDPAHIDAIAGLGSALFYQRRLGEAEAVFRRGCAIAPDSADLQWSLSNTALSLGDFATGWAAFEARWRKPAMAPGWYESGAPTWNGTDSLDGKTILLFAEQGFGDTIQFVRFAPLVAERGAKVILLTQPELVSLLAPMPGVAVCLGFGSELPHIDLQCPLMSLPLRLGISLDTIPAKCPYLAPDPEAASAWAQRLAALPGLRTGLVWAGNPRLNDPEATRVDQRRSLRLNQLGPLAKVEGVSFVSLQKGYAAEQTGAGLAGVKLHDWTSELDSFADTAALVQNLDLVIAVDTAVAHLAAALGRPVWLLNRFDSCWRWLDGRDDSPWYPTLRQFRQTGPGDWEGVVSRVGAALKDRVLEA
ncbi:MAG TPA: tetratricopeptide repeat protein [Alphaproteobacteria bacterium]|jgi:Flp pilus assembly protein TadD|nr:tetratricopeptide repeat protein [Alphaproteobacteria bacterium]